MPFIILAALFLGKFQNVNLLEKLSVSSISFHQKCLSMMPPSPTVFVQTSLLCGENLRNAEWKHALTRTSLIHLFVVSGSHLVLLEQILLFLRLPLFARFFLWFLFTLLCGWQAPLVRALVSAAMWRLPIAAFWPRDISVLLSGLMTLILFPEWSESRSLLMSWTAAIALSGGSILWERQERVTRFCLISAGVYLLMLPLLWGFGNLHPLSILYNIFLGVFVSLWLWPLSFLCVILPFLSPILFGSSQFFLMAMKFLSDPIAVENARPLDLRWLWSFIFLLHCAMHFARLHVRRRRL